MAVSPDWGKFKEQFAESSVVPLSVKFILEDTPLSLLSAFPAEAFVCLLESLGALHKPEESRYHILGLDPKATFSFDGTTVLEQWQGQPPKRGEPTGVIRQLDDFLRGFHSIYDDSMPLSNGGLIGYVSRDLMSPSLAPQKDEGQSLPLVHFVVPQTFIIFDSVKHQFTLLVNAFSHTGQGAESAYAEAKRLLDARIANLFAPRTRPSSLLEGWLPERTTDEPDLALTDLAHSLSEAAKHKQVSSVYLNRSVRRKTTADPLSVYRLFRVVYPSAYCYLFRINGAHYIGSHELAEGPRSLSFANLLRHTLQDARFIGLPSHEAFQLRAAEGLRYRHDSAIFGYVGFNGLYKLTHGNKEVILKAVGSGYEAMFSRALKVTWQGIASVEKPTLTVSNAGSISATINEILATVEHGISPGDSQVQLPRKES